MFNWVNLRNRVNIQVGAKREVGQAWEGGKAKERLRDTKKFFLPIELKYQNCQ